MNIILSILIAILTIFALKRHNAPQTNGLCNKRFLVAAGCASFLYIDRIFNFFSPTIELAYKNNFLWSILLMPIYAVLLTAGFKFIFGEKVDAKYLITSIGGTLLVVILFNLLGREGVALFSPISNHSFALHLLHSFDLGLFFILLVGSILVFVFKNKRRDLARGFLVIVAIYLIVVVSFMFKAKEFANEYATALNLKVEKTYAIAQPLSIFNWRLMIFTEDNKIHNAFITLKDTQPHFENDDRTNRVAQLYKPRPQANWRIYRRVNPYYEKQYNAVLKHYGDKAVLKNTLEFSILTDSINYKQFRCLRFKDLRSEGVRKSLKGNVLFCQNPTTKNIKILYGTKDEYIEISWLF